MKTNSLLSFRFVFAFISMLPLLQAGRLNAQNNPIQLFHDGNAFPRMSRELILCGEEVRINASGEIVVGVFAGKRTPAGVTSYDQNRYNIFPNKPHCALMVSIVEVGQSINMTDYSQLDWQICGSSYTFKANKRGYLIFDINESLNWRWDNAPIGRGFQINVSLPDRQNDVSGRQNEERDPEGHLNKEPVYRSGDNILFGCKQFKKEADGWWHITDQNGSPVGLYEEKEPKLFAYVGRNEHVGSENEVYADVKEQNVVVYKSKRVEKSENDKRWYLKDSKGACEGIVDIKQGAPFVYPDDERLEDLLEHLNRNKKNLEAKGRLRYLCTNGLLSSFSTYRLYLDEAGCIWVLLAPSESGYHRNPDKPDETGFKLVRLDPENKGASFESIRIPSKFENRNSATITGLPRSYKLGENTRTSYNLRDTEWRGSYNFAHSTYDTWNILDHFTEDMTDHNDYKDYMIFPERFGAATAAEKQFVKLLDGVPLDTDGERSCPSN